MNKWIIFFYWQNLESRRFYQIHPVSENYVAPQVLAKYFPIGHLGVDKYNNYLTLIRFGMMDAKGILLSERQKICLTFMCKEIEKSVIAARNEPMKYKRSPNATSQSTIIMDMDEFTMRHITYKPGKRNPT